MKTPRTDTAAFNGHEYLLKEAKSMEVEMQKMAESLEWLILTIDKLGIDRPGWNEIDDAKYSLANYRAKQDGTQ